MILNFICVLPHKVLVDLRLLILGNKEKLEKSQNRMEIRPGVQSPLAKSVSPLALINKKKTAIKVFRSCRALLDFLIYLKIFCTGFSVGRMIIV